MSASIVNWHAIRAIYLFEMARTWRTPMQSILSPVISTSLYFVVFGAAIGSRMQEIDGIAYGAFIVPGLIMLSLLTQSIANASFAIIRTLTGAVAVPSPPPSLRVCARDPPAVKRDTEVNAITVDRRSRFWGTGFTGCLSIFYRM